MEPFIGDADLTIYNGDALEVLRSLPDRSVHMCATSPPFFGLRDYQTGTWEGGDPECDHAVRKEIKTDSSTLGGGRKNSGHQQEGYGAECGRCGARRVDRQIGLEATTDEWVERLVAVFREVRRVLRDDGTLWVEIGDSYASKPGGAQGENGQRASRTFTAESMGGIPEGYKPKDLLGQPWLLAFALRADGWYLRSEIIWHKLNAMPESVNDRPTKSHSTIFLLSKQARYFFDADAIREPYKYDGRKVLEINGTSEAGHENYANREGKTRWPGGVDGGANARSVWTQATEPTPFAHFATWPSRLVARMIQAGTSERGCCPECGAPWVRETLSEASVAQRERYAGKGHVPVHRGGGDRPGGFYPEAPRTLGWSPSCAHDHNPVPATVIDPFAGSGTTNLVARRYGRRSIGIELNPDYCQLIADRTMQQTLI